jgi:hypothetical protein
MQAIHQGSMIQRDFGTDGDLIVLKAITKLFFEVTAIAIPTTPPP